jgi:hypothetical protein
MTKMQKSARSRAEERFAATQKEKDKAQQEIMQRMAKLRALRLAKEAADKEAAESEDAKAKVS